DAVRRVGLGHRGVEILGQILGGVAEDVDPRGSGVIPVEVDLTALEGLAHGRAARDTGLVGHIGAGVLEREDRDLAEDVRLGELLRADGERGAVELVARRAAARAAVAVATGAAGECERDSEACGRERGCLAHSLHGVPLLVVSWTRWCST